MTRRKLDALRNLAERPGTPAEGRVAIEKLRRAEEVDWKKDPSYPGNWHAEGLRCDCGEFQPGGFLCVNKSAHDRVNSEMWSRFTRGQRVYYNCWAYPPNCPGIFSSFSGVRWNWAYVKFDHLKSVREVPVYQRGLWHLSTEPLTAAEMIPLRGGMERFE